MAKKKIVLMCDAVTLAHPLRSAALLNMLSPDAYDAVFYSSGAYSQYLPPLRHPHKNIFSLTPQEFNRRVMASKPIYSRETVASYLAAEREVLAAEKPDLVIGDTRSTLQISAREAGVPYATLLDVHWSPYLPIPYRMMDMPATRVVPLAWVDAMVNQFPALCFSPHVGAVDRQRRQVKLPALHDIRAMYANADVVFHPNAPPLEMQVDYPAHHHFIGPVDPPFATEPPVWWGDVPKDRPLIYVNLGSSGDTSLLQRLVVALRAATDATLVVTTGSEAVMQQMPAGVFAAPVIANTLVIPHATLMIGNGGVLSTTAAGLAGCYYIAMCANPDQIMNMQLVERVGMGKYFRQPSREVERIVALAASLPRVPAGRVQAMQQQVREYDASVLFPEIVARYCR